MPIIPKSITQNNDAGSHAILALRTIVMGSVVLFSLWKLSDDNLGFIKYVALSLISVVLYFGFKSTIADWRRRILEDRESRPDVLKRELHVIAFFVSFVSVLALILWGIFSLK
jgi:hypothetical protein